VSPFVDQAVRAGTDARRVQCRPCGGDESFRRPAHLDGDLACFGHGEVVSTQARLTEMASAL
jgi:hypothetical protein